MTPPARRDGTPDNRSARNSGRGRADTPSTPDTDTTLDTFIPDAKPAKRQRVTEEELQAVRERGTRPGKAEAEGASVRLQKVLASAGVASRRMSEKLIAAGRVEVNGSVVKQMGLRINPEIDIVRVDGTRIHINDSAMYFVLNKPRGVHSTMHDDMGRPCVGDIVAERLPQGHGLFHVGRLDAATEGLLLLTNDGELANRLTHPRYEVSKTYMATVLGEVGRSIIRELKQGVELDDGIARADNVQIVDVWQGKSLLKIELHEGRKHIVRRMLKESGYPVQALVRTKIHTVQLGEQRPGTIRALNHAELTSLYKAVGL